MAYTEKRGSALRLSEFSDFRKRVVALLNDDPNNPVNFGYGHQPAGFLAKRGKTITADDWNILRADVAKIHKHQYGSEPTETVLPSAVRGRVITQNQFAKMEAIIAKLESTPNLANVAGMEYLVLGSGTRATAWGAGATSIKSIETITFASTDAARYFFNSGGSINIKMSHPRNRISPQDLDWMEMLARVGTISITANEIKQVGNTGMAIKTTAAATGWYGMSTTELTVLDAVNSGNVYRHTFYTKYNAYQSAYQPNDVKVTVSKTTPATNGQVKLVIAVTLTDDHNTVWSDSVSAGTKVTVEALKASSPINNIATPAWSTTNFTSMAAGMRVMMFSFAPSNVVQVSVDNLEKFKLTTSPKLSVSDLGGKFKVTVPGENIEYVEIYKPEQTTVKTVIAGKSITNDTVEIDYTASVPYGESCKASLRVKVFGRAKWLNIDYIDLTHLGGEYAIAYESDYTVSSGYALTMVVDGDTVSLHPKDQGRIDMASLSNSKDPLFSKLVPPKLVSSKVAEQSVELKADFTNTSKIGSLNFRSRATMLEVDSVLFDVTKDVFAKAKKDVSIVVSTQNVHLSTHTLAVLMVDLSHLPSIESVIVEPSIPSRNTESVFTVVGSAYDNSMGKWKVTVKVDNGSLAKFVAFRVKSASTEYVFREIPIITVIDSFTKVNAEINNTVLSSTEVAPVFMINNAFTKSDGVANLVIREQSGSFPITKVYCKDAPNVAWQSEGSKDDNSYAVRFVPPTELCSIVVESRSKVYEIEDMRMTKSYDDYYIGFKNPNPKTITLTHKSIISKFSDRVEILLSLKSSTVDILNFKTDGWSSGWGNYPPPGFTVAGNFSASDGMSKTEVVDISKWTNAAYKDLSILVKFADGTHANVTVDIMTLSGTHDVDLKDNSDH